MVNAREAAFLAVLNFLSEGSFIEKSLEQWQQKSKPAAIDLHLAQEIAYGTIRMASSLDYIAEQLADRKVQLKKKEKALLRTAIYQYYYMDRLPSYAITNESMKIANHYCHYTFARFLNALLRKLSQNKPKLPPKLTSKDLAITYSYPQFFIDQLINDIGLPQAVEVLKVGNHPGVTMARLRAKPPEPLLDGLELIVETPFPVVLIKDRDLMNTIINSTTYYIQNVTPASLIGRLGQLLKIPPQNILDLCASPGGKLIAVHDLFPKAILYANDISEEKNRTLSKNLEKYNIQATLSCCPGESLTMNEKFDLIILDIPCSNSGVFNKRPEARWRYSDESLKELKIKQQQLIHNALSLLSPTGHLWYMTCSVLKNENEIICQNACQLYQLHIEYMENSFTDIRRLGWGICVLFEKTYGLNLISMTNLNILFLKIL